MAQITEAQLFEMLGRLFAELRATNAESERLRAMLEAQRVEKPERSDPKSRARAGHSQKEVVSAHGR